MDDICIVGLGNHARTKLIPAVLASGRRLAGLVSTQSRDDLPEAPLFRRLEDALAALPANTTFVIATPPAVHFQQAMAVICSGRDVVVEKPAFVTCGEIADAFNEAARRSVIIVEAFMHRHTDLYRQFIELWNAQRDHIEAIDMTFLVPSLPANSFRQNSDAASSSLYDIGSYALSLFADLDLPLDGLDVDDLQVLAGGAGETIALSGLARDVRLRVRIGVAPDYTNKVAVETVGGVVEMSPFFYGRAGDKTIRRQGSEGAVTTTLLDGNAFERMFAVPRDAWVADQIHRRDTMLATTAGLERLAKTLARKRKQFET